MRFCRHLVLSILAAFVFTLSSAPADAAAGRATASEMARFFHDDLAPYGRWIDHPAYGVVWVPDSGQPDWHPYWDGRWVWTSEYGWYWHSHEPYGWATYHYGRWVLTSEYGWVWVPGDEWGPSFVEWRYGDGYAGWTPTPPDHDASRHDHQSAGAAVGARAWIFVPQQDITRASPGMQATTGEAVDKLLAASKMTTGATLASAVHAKPESIAIATSAAEQAAASARGSVAIYRPPLLAAPSLDGAAARGLNLDLPGTNATGLDADALAKAQAQVDSATQPRKAINGSVDTSVGGTFGSDAGVRSPAPSSASGIGVGVPGVGGLRLGR